MKRAEVKLLGIVARSADYKDNDKLVTILTNNGSLNVILKGVKSEKAKLKLAASLFSYCEYFCLDGELKQVKNAVVISPHIGITMDLKKYAAASIIVEASEKLCRVGGETIAEFEVVKNALDVIDEGGISPLLVSIVALKTLFDIEGVDLAEYAISERVRTILAYIDNSDGSYDSLDCTEGDILAVLNTFAKVIQHAFSIRLNSVGETIKALSSSLQA